MKHIGININSSKVNAIDARETLKNMITTKDSEVEIPYFDDSIGLDEDLSKKIDALIVLGGDGTLLNSARNLFRYGVPILGINIGNLGFLTEVDFKDASVAIDSLLSGDFQIESRVMLKCSFLMNQEEINCVALNDVVLSKGNLARIIKYDLHIGDAFYATIVADGIITSTPTGSTAYSFSAGGPIIYPTLDLLSITPICANSIFMKSLVVGGENEILVDISKNEENVFLSCDGQKWIELEDVNQIRIAKAEYECKLIKLSNKNYFDVLRKKITYRTKECEGENYESIATW